MTFQQQNGGDDRVAALCFPFQSAGSATSVHRIVPWALFGDGNWVANQIIIAKQNGKMQKLSAHRPRTFQSWGHLRNRSNRSVRCRRTNRVNNTERFHSTAHPFVLEKLHERSGPFNRTIDSQVRTPRPSTPTASQFDRATFHSRNGCHNRDRPMRCPFETAPWRSPGE